ncbi:MAG TPA: sugar ABC transporter ATP-binding protein, partial [Deltaproteobacteria bacterium]|nr:sugar ABC transporter ATP-binding protein [Deltaproteobacteria bacterium]
NNFFVGEIVDKDGQLLLDCQEIVFPMKKQPSSDSQKVIAAVRPENINVSFQEQKDWLKVTLKSVQPTGANTILQVKHGNTEITLLQPEFIRMKLDEPLWIRFDPESLNFFDEETGKNLHL